MKKDGFIFDVDGTLFDTNPAHVTAWQRAFSRLGHDVAPERIRPEIGKGGDKLVPAILGQAVEEREGEALRTAHGEEFLRIADRGHFSVFPGVRGLFAELRRRGVRTALATSSKADHLESTLRSAGVDPRPLVDVVVTKDDAARSKPAPDLVEAAVACLGLPAECCAMVGDTVHDGEACRKARVDFVGLTCGGTDRRALAAATARWVFSTPEELLIHLDAVLAGTV
jgi:phosphoglycolate phosphatase-like HAD superfamily hydrolase